MSYTGSSILSITINKSLTMPKGKSEAIIQRTEYQKESGQKYRQWSTKYYTENRRLNNTNPT
jgi:hypothetical protein